MPGIFGVGAAQQGAQQGGMSALFADMATRMRHHAWYRESGYVDEKAGIAQIPVKEAMHIIADKGLPAIVPAPEKKPENKTEKKQ